MDVIKRRFADIPDVSGLLCRYAGGATAGGFGDRQPRARFAVGRGHWPVRRCVRQKRIPDDRGRGVREGARRHRDREGRRPDPPEHTDELGGHHIRR